LQQLEGQQRPCRGARVRVQSIPNPEAERPKWSLASPCSRRSAMPVPCREPMAEGRNGRVSAGSAA
jgi:hypothetical protein